MIHPRHLAHLERFSSLYNPRMLMLGKTTSAVPEYKTAKDYFARWVGDEYHDLDLDGGKLELDLNQDLSPFFLGYETVFNLGTLEHVWNAHQAWSNALDAVNLGGHFLNASPIEGFARHGIHITNPDAIVAFVEKNGFRIVDRWTSRPSAQGIILWFAARRDVIVSEFRPPYQVYRDGKKLPIE